MRRTLLLAACFALAFVGVAVAATYKTGRYEAGSSTGDGVKLRIRKGSFSVSRVSFMETCSSATDSFDDRFTFLKGTEAKLTGKITKKGRLSGSYESSGGRVDVTGRVKGSKATVNASESGAYTAQNGKTYNCEGSHTFHAKRLVISTGPR